MPVFGYFYENNVGMRRRISFFQPEAIQHIYQRAADKGVIFYTIEDRLVYYTLAAVNAKKCKIKVFSASIMFTHLHQGVQAESLEVIRKYLHDTDTAFTRLYNFRYSRKGRLFNKKTGMAQKSSSKDKRANIIYIFNNHVEKKLCSKALQERWSLLAYAVSDHPFSDELNIDKASRRMKKAINLVNRRVLKNKCLEYKDLDKILPYLEDGETEQFIDYVISKYAWIDFRAAVSLFENIDSMLLAIDSTTGGEYDIKEEYTRMSDIAYKELVNYALKRKCISSIFSMTQSEKGDHILLATKLASAAVPHLEKFFHIELQPKSKKML